MTEKMEIHGHELEFLKNEGKAVIEIDLGEMTDECYLIDIFSVDGTDYVALISNTSTDIYLFYYEDSFEEDEIDLKVIEDEEELETVFHLFNHYWDDEAIDEILADYEEDLDGFNNMNAEIEITEIDEIYIDDDEDFSDDLLDD